MSRPQALEPQAFLPVQPGSSSLCFSLMTYSDFIFHFYLFVLAVLGLRCCTGFLCSEQGLLVSWAHRLLVAAAPVAEHWLEGEPAPAATTRGLQTPGSAVVAHGLGCCAACGVFPEQGSNHVSCINRRLFYH